MIDDARPIDEPGWLEVQDGWFELLPGETREIELRWAGVPVQGRRIRFHGWNVDLELSA
jgi:hypothetical protein